MLTHIISRASTLLAMVALVAAPAMASAATPGTATVEGALLSSGGAPAADGEYDLSFALYAAATGGTAAWSDGPMKVMVKGGRFSAALGAGKALDAKTLATLATPFLGVTVGTDPELPRQPVRSAPYAVLAGSAEALACTGCVSGDQIANGAIAAAKLGFNFAGSSTKGGPALDLACSGCVNVAELKFDADVDLGGNSIKAGNGTFSGDVSAKSVTATSFVGDGSKLTGIKTPAGTCSKPGEVVKGIKADGTLECVAALDPSALPKDGIDEISNGLIGNQFVDTIAGQAGLAIPDNTGADANSELTFPDIGLAQDFELTVEISNTDLSTVALTVLPPDDKKTGWTLCDPCGDKDSKSYKKTFNKSTLPKSGDLAAWINANPKGLWNLKVLDTSYCIPQAPGNAALCDTIAKTDGKIIAWSIKIQTLSNKKVSANGDVYVDGKIWGKDNGHGKPGGDLQVGAGLVAAGGIKVGAPGTCDAVHLGTLAWSTKYGLVVCNTNPPKTGPMQYAWTVARSRPVSFQGGCKSHSQGSGWADYCLDGVEWNDAEDYFTVNANGTITVKISGHYRMFFYAIQHGCGSQNLQFLVNGSYKAYSHNIAPSASNQWHQAELEFNGPLMAGDSVKVQAYHDGCGNQYQWHSWNSGGAHSRFRLEYEGPMAGK
ncbi:MAG: hypothetical protein H6747_07380 [Deltaproteobacteria bacterium]|nr:hypothetical protein [Deltaproteobacteria bacterium]